MQIVDVASYIPRIPTYSYSKSFFFRFVAEIEAIEACSWLQQAGFPQYVQLFEDNKFPIDLQAVETDHSFLDEQLLKSLFRLVLEIGGGVQAV